MDSDHALCRECKNVVRLDWERCFHCGVSTPVAAAAGSSLVRTGVTIAGLVLLVTAVVNAPTLWRTARQAPSLVTREVTVPQVALPASVTGPAAAYGPTTGVARTGPSAAIRTAAVSAGDVARRAEDRTPPGAAAARLDQEATARAIAACESVAAVDSLEQRLRTTHPGDPSLDLGGRSWRLMKARRAALALR
jgi:hypothetical protein